MSGRFVPTSKVSPPQGAHGDGAVRRFGVLGRITSIWRVDVDLWFWWDFDAKSAGGMVVGWRFGEGNGLDIDAVEAEQWRLII
jgi:hypothetical protein